MALGPGTEVWIPCRVRRAEFPDRRVVNLRSAEGDWEGLLDVHQLREAIDDGETAVIGTIVESSDRGVTARLPGQVDRRQFFTAPLVDVEKLPRV